MAVTSNTYTVGGSGQAGPYPYSFPILADADVKVSVNGDVKTVTTHYTLDSANTRITFTSGNHPSTGDKVIVYRDTDEDPIKSVFSSGSTLRSNELNDNFNQLLYIVQENDNQSMSTLGGVMQGNLGLGLKNNLYFEGDTDDAYETTVTVVDPTADRTITLPDTTGTVVTTGDTGTIVSNMIADTTIVGGKIANDTLTASQIAPNAITTSELADNAVDTAAIADDAVTTAKIAAGNITATEIADNAVTHGKMADNSVGTAELRNGEVTNAKLGADCVDGSKIADDAIGSEHIQANAVGTSEIADAELVTLAGMPSATASVLADSTALTSTTAELNQLDGKTITGTFTAGNANDIPTSSAINSHFVALLDSLGGFVAIANDASFPNTNPDPSDNAGTTVSISDAGGIVVDSNGSSTTARTLGGSTVTITGFPTSLRSKTLADNLGLQVQTTSTLNTYTYHKLIGKEGDISQLSDDINDFNARYRVGGSNPTSDNDSGDLFFNTGTGKMLVYDGTTSAWEEVQSVGSFFINTLSSYSGTGGNSATFNGSAYRFNLSNAGTVAEQHLVSINGVIQKPNSGTGQPSEGFAIDGSSILFSSAPASGSDYFIVTIGSTVNINTPSANSIVENAIQSNVVSEEKLKISNAGTDGQFLSKQSGNSGGLTWATVDTTIADDSIAEVKLDIHNAPSGTDKYLKYTSNGMEWATVAQYTTPLTTRGDILFRDASGDQRLPKGTAGQYLKQGANDPEWAEVIGAVADGCIFENDQTISNNYTIAAGKGAHSVGPITVNATVTVNGNWVVS